MLSKNLGLFFVLISLFSEGWSSDDMPEPGALPPRSCLKRPASFQRSGTEPQKKRVSFMDIKKEPEDKEETNVQEESQPAPLSQRSTSYLDLNDASPQ